MVPNITPTPVPATGPRRSGARGPVNSWLAAAPEAQVAHSRLGCMTAVNDLADRPPRPLNEGEVIDLGGKRMRRIETPHITHGCDAGI